jgi:hypothetical protein
MTKIERFEEQHTDAGTEHCTDKRANRDRLDIRAFAEQFRLKVTQDECRDPIIEGRRGHLYFDEGELCLMAFDARVAGMGDTALGALGGKLWTGDAYKDPRQRRRRDVKIQGIPEANWPAAIRILQIPRLPRLSAEERAARSSRLKSIRANSASGVFALESSAAPGIKVREAGKSRRAILAAVAPSLPGGGAPDDPRKGSRLVPAALQESEKEICQPIVRAVFKVLRLR